MQRHKKKYLATDISYNVPVRFSPKGSRRESASAKAWAFHFLTCNPKRTVLITPCQV